MNTVTKISFAAMTMLAVGVSTAQAAPITVDLRYKDMAYGSENINYQLNGVNNNTNAGLFKFSFSNINGAFPFEFGTDLLTFCIEITKGIRTDVTLTYTLKPLHELFGIAKADAITRLYTGFADQVAGPTGSAAFQLALWEVIDDFSPASWTSLNLNSGNFVSSTNNITASIAQNWLGQLSGIESKYQMYALTNEFSQNQLVFTGTQPTPPIPQVSAPTTLGLMGLSLLALGWRRK